MNTMNVSPSTFGFLYDECQACFYLDAHRLSRRPRAPFPAIFTTIDLAMKRHFADGKDHKIPGLDLPFRLYSQGKWVQSMPIATTSSTALVVRGVYDSLLLLGGCKLAVCDFKTAPVKDTLVSKYSRQLHAYARALERPERGLPLKVLRLGLAVFDPSRFAVGDSGATLDGKFSWLEIERDEATFDNFLNNVASLLALPNAPHSSPECEFCRYRKVA